MQTLPEALPPVLDIPWWEMPPMPVPPKAHKNHLLTCGASVLPCPAILRSLSPSLSLSAPKSALQREERKGALLTLSVFSSFIPPGNDPRSAACIPLTEKQKMRNILSHVPPNPDRPSDPHALLTAFLSKCSSYLLMSRPPVHAHESMPRARRPRLRFPQVRYRYPDAAVRSFHSRAA